MIDLLIKNAEIYDGTGAPSRRGNILVNAGRIADVGAIEAPAAQTVDATGLAAAPGFIDVHSHDDFHVLAEPDVTHNVLQGITTVIVGNCGFGAAPSSADRDQMKTIEAAVRDAGGAPPAEW